MLLIRLAALSSLISSCTALRGNGNGNGNKDKSDVAQSIQQQLNDVLAAGNAKLKAAEEMHEKVLTSVRSDAAADLSSKASELGTAVFNYAADLKAAQNRLSTSINATQAGLARLSGSLDVATRARLGAKIGMAQRDLKHALRKQDSAMEAANRRAEQPLEKEADALMSMWVGDLNKAVSDSKEKLHAVADVGPESTAKATNDMMQDDDDGLLSVLKGHGFDIKPPAPAPSKASVVQTSKPKAPTVKAATAPKTQTVASLEADISAADKSLDVDTKAAKKKLDDAIAKVVKDDSTFIADSKKKLDAAQKQATDSVKLQF